MALEVADGLADEGLELLEHDDTVHSLFTGHFYGINRTYLHVLLFDLQRRLLEQGSVLLLELLA